MIVHRTRVLFKVGYFRGDEQQVTFVVITRLVSFVRWSGEVRGATFGCTFGSSTHRYTSVYTTIATGFNFVICTSRYGSDMFSIRTFNGTFSG